MNLKLFKKTITDIEVLGKKGTSTDYHLSSSLIGLRVNVYRLEGVSATKIALVSGDGKAVSLKSYMEFTRHNPTEDVIRQTVNYLIEHSRTLKNNTCNTN
jgi:hypothetical protein